MSDIIVVGGGASGIMSAISAKIHNPGISVTVLERSSKALKKLLATGNGRCNMLNTDIRPENYHGSDVGSAMEIMKKADTDFLSDLFESFGLLITKRFAPLIYPNSMQASSVREILLTTAYEKGVKIFLDYDITEIKAIKNGFSVKNKKGKELTCKKLILSGGTAATMGSNSALDLLSSLSHKTADYYPALCPIVCREKEFFKTADGARAYAKLTLFSNGKEVKSDFGEIQFTAYGLSGIVTMQLSGETVFLLNQGKNAELSVSLFEDLGTVYSNLDHMRASYKRLSLHSALCAMINSSVAEAVIGRLSLNGNTLLSGLNGEDIKKTAKLLCDMRFTPTGSKGESFAQVFGGGGLLCDFDSDLRSRKNSSLYAVGEMLDIYGDCGGYNLTWAWASGYTAGKAAALDLKNYSSETEILQ